MEAAPTNWFVALIMGLMSLCSGAGEPATPVEAEPAKTAVRAAPPAEWTACKADGECRLIATVCCDCDAGDYVAVHKDHTGEASDEFGHTKKCDCPEMDCPPIDAKCVEGTCRAVER